MSGAISGIGGSLAAVLLADSQGLHARVDALTRQAASGEIATTYGGLGAAAPVSLNLRPQLGLLQAWSDNVAAAGMHLTTTQSVLQQLHDIASSFAASVTGVGTQTPSGVDALATQAATALTQVENLLNTSQNGSYLLAGADSANPPVPSGTFAAYVAGIATAAGGLAAGTGAATASAVLAAASAASPFSPTLPTTAAQVAIGPGQSVPVGVVAGTNSQAVMTGASTTGSWAKDLLAGLAAISALKGSDVGLGTDFGIVTGAVGQTLQGAAAAVNTDMAGLGAVQQTLAARATAIEATQTAVTTQLGSAEDVDMATTATALAQLQTQLQASYKLIAGLPQMSLVNYI
jgi:flagellar hook-associated protein 3 FlgL